MTNRTLTADARNRALRTFITGLGIDVLVGVVLVLVTAFADVGSWGEVQWSILSLSIVKSIVQAGGAFILRRFDDSSGIPTPLPPSDPVAPDAADERGAVDVGWVGVLCLLGIVLILLAVTGHLHF